MLSTSYQYRIALSHPHSTMLPLAHPTNLDSPLRLETGLWDSYQTKLAFILG